MKKFWIKAGTFSFNIEIVISEDKKKVAKYMNKRFHLPNKEYNYTYDASDFEVLGRYCKGGRYCSRIYLPKMPKTGEQVATLVHELQHAIFDLANFFGLSYSKESEEVYTHLLSHLTAQCFKKLKITVKK